MKKYYRGWTTLSELPNGTEKAIPLEIAMPSPLDHRIVWIPRSQIIIGEPNQYGNAEVLIPLWLLYSNGICLYKHPAKLFRDIEEYGDGSPRFVER